MLLAELLCRVLQDATPGFGLAPGAAKVASAWTTTILFDVNAPAYVLDSHCTSHNAARYNRGGG